MHPAVRNSSGRKSTKAKVGTNGSNSIRTGNRKHKGKNTWLTWLLVLLGLFVLGTFIVLSTVKHYFGTHAEDLITLAELRPFRTQEFLPYDPTLRPEELAEERERTGLYREKIPRIIHATWKNDTLPERWQAVREGCKKMLPDFEFKLWSDDGSRDFIKKEYPNFLATWDSYPYTIQRADAIRYFVLHKFGGIYMDLDIGCRAHPGPLLHFETILPITKPVGVSNDLIFSAPATPFMDLTINSLETFNHDWLLMNYPTVMFSTGPMFISAIYSLWCRILAKGVGVQESAQIQRARLLPKSLYGKNAKAEDVPDSFFWHYYGSSWHAKDAGFIGFLGKYGYTLLILGSSLVVLGFCYLLWTKRHIVMTSPLQQPKYLLEPFELRPPPRSSVNAHDGIAEHIKSSLKNFLTVFVKIPKAVTPENPYFPLPSQTDPLVRSRPASIDQDTVSLHSLHGIPASRQNGTTMHQHPVTKKPHARQRSRDVERGSPVRSRSSSNAPPDASRTTLTGGWFWTSPQILGSSPAMTSSEAMSGNLLRRTISPDSIMEEPRIYTDDGGEGDDNNNFKSVPQLIASPLQENPALLSPSLTAEGGPLGLSRPKLSRNHSRKLSDSDSSELYDHLADLEPVGSASSTRPAGTPITEHPSSATRKRALSANGSATVAGSQSPYFSNFSIPNTPSQEYR